MGNLGAHPAKVEKGRRPTVNDHGRLDVSVKTPDPTQKRWTKIESLQGVQKKAPINAIESLLLVERERRARRISSPSMYSRRSRMRKRLDEIVRPRTPHVWSGPLIVDRTVKRRPDGTGSDLIADIKKTWSPILCVETVILLVENND